MAGTIMPSPWFTGLDDNGVTVIGGKLYTYLAGTSVPEVTYSDVSLQVPNSNPVILDGGGRATVYLSATSYKFVLKDQNDVTIRTQDHIAANAPFNVDLDIAGVAGENLFAGAVVYLSVGAVVGTLPGRWYLADADVADASIGADFIAMSPQAVLAGAVGAFRLQGRTVVAPATLTVGAPYFVSTTAGLLVTPAPVLPAFERLVGIADSPNTVVTATGFGGPTVISGDVNIGGNLAVAGQTSLDGDLVFSNNFSVRRNTLDTADTGAIQLAGGGGANSTRGAVINLTGNENATPGTVYLVAGNVPDGSILFFSGADLLRGKVWPSGGFTWGAAMADPGIANVGIAGNLGFSPAGGVLYLTTVDGADTAGMQLAGGGGANSTRGAVINLTGNENATPGTVYLVAGNVPDGSILFFSGADLLRGKVWPSGGFSWGAASTDPGLGRIILGGPFVPGSPLTLLEPGGVALGTAGTAAANVLSFFNANGNVGGVVTSGTTTAFNTTSDAQLKIDRGPVVATEVLARTLVHDFEWKADGAHGRGVFGQEAIAVLPAAVTRGDGARPWQVDYSKYVPDLIVGWQAHEARMRAMLARLERVESRRDGDETS